MCKEVLMQVYIGIDWSEKKHDAVFINEAGAIQHRVNLTIRRSIAPLMRKDLVFG